MSVLSILSIGSEITRGFIVDTNSNFIVKEARLIGLETKFIIQVSDNRKDIISSLEFLSKHSDVIITTGGLGPTQDDLTRECISEFTGVDFVKSEEILGNIKDKFRKLKKPMPEINEKQAYVPLNGIVIKNSIGSAPGFIVEKDNKFFISLPGVPQEMKEMFRYYVKDFLRSRTSKNNTIQLFAKVLGVPESELDEIVFSYFGGKLSYGTVADYGVVDIIFNIPEEIYPHFKREVIETLNRELEMRYGSSSALVLFTDEREDIFKILYEVFTSNDLTLAVAESASGGTLSGLITNIPGASKYFLGGIVSYTPVSKMKILSISEEIIKKHTTVSPKITAEMAVNVRNLLKSDYSVAITGVAGPTLDESMKDIGTFFVSVSSFKRDVPVTREYKLYGNREKLKFHSSVKAVELLLKIVSEDGYKYNI